MKEFAKKYSLITNALDQSPIALQALADLQQMQKALVTLLGDDPRGYQNLQQAEEKDKAQYLLQTLDENLILVDASVGVLGNTISNPTSNPTSNPISNPITNPQPSVIQHAIPVLPSSVMRDVPAPAADSAAMWARVHNLEVRLNSTLDHAPQNTALPVTEAQLNQVQSQVDDLQQRFRQTVQQRPAEPQNIVISTVERGRQLEAMSVDFTNQLDRNGLFSGANTTITVQRAIPMIIRQLSEVTLNMESLPGHVALGIEQAQQDAIQLNLNTQIELTDTNQRLIRAQRDLAETRQRTQALENNIAEITAAHVAAAAQQQARCCTIS